jgi:hypothetical protein
MSTADWIGAFVGLFLTLSVFSYLLKDNALFRLVIHLFIGVTTGFVVVVTWKSVLFPQLIQPLIDGDWYTRLLLTIPLILSILLFFRLFPRLSFLGSPVLALLVGVGAATAIAGAAIGTIYPQVKDTVDLFEVHSINFRSSNFWYQLFNAVFILVGTITTLVYFQFGVKSKKKSEAITEQTTWLNRLGRIGQGFIAVAFGALFTGVLLATLVALISRLQAILQLVNNLLPGG